MEPGRTPHMGAHIGPIWVPYRLLWEYALAYDLLLCNKCLKNVTITSLHTGQVIQHVLFQKSLFKLVIDVMFIAR